MRILKVVLVLLVLGAISGALVGVLFLEGMVLIRRHEVLSQGEFYAAAAMVGAIAGALSGPTIAFLFLRRVPLWRATMETAAAAGLGAAVGGLTNVNWAGVVGAVLFGLAAALRLRYAYRPQSSIAPTHSSEG